MSHELKITRHFQASPTQVYEAWTKPELFSQWMGPGSVSCIKIDADLQIDGAYEIHMQTDEGIKIAHGVYKTIEPNQALAFTWQWKDTDMPETLVSLCFSESEGGTEMALHHTLLASDESAQHHTFGWNGSIEKLENFLSKN